MTALWWIRRDLRLTDNPTLHASLEAGSVIPVFILDPRFDSASPRRRDFLYEGLHALDRDLRQRRSYLVIRRGKPLEVLQSLLAETGLRPSMPKRTSPPMPVSATKKSPVTCP